MVTASDFDGDFFFTTLAPLVGETFFPARRLAALVITEPSSFAPPSSRPASAWRCSRTRVLARTMLVRLTLVSFSCSSLALEASAASLFFSFATR